MGFRRAWEIEFEPGALFGSADFAAMFGRFTYRSVVLAKAVTTPFAVFARAVNGRCSSLQFMDDTFATGVSFRSGGSWTFRSDPDVVRHDRHGDGLPGPSEEGKQSLRERLGLLLRDEMT